MNHRETAIEANRQIRLLMKHCSEDECKKIRKYIRNIPDEAQPKVNSVSHISEPVYVILRVLNKKFRRVYV